MQKHTMTKLLSYEGQNILIFKNKIIFYLINKLHISETNQCYLNIVLKLLLIWTNRKKNLCASSIADFIDWNFFDL